ncbi:MAG TPA: hypothetical protein VFM56_04560, partial [Solimonas sp.]|nr:hypothetical protein [Solimonas sp.]
MDEAEISTVATGTADAVPAINRRAAAARLDGIETVTLDAGTSLRIALPETYQKKSRARFPLVLVLDPGDCFGASAEIARLMASTGEIENVIVVALRAAPQDDAQTLAGQIAGKILPACRARYRVAEGRTMLCDLATQGRAALPALWNGIDGIAHFVIAAPDADVMRAQLQRTPGASGAGRRHLVLVAPDAQDALSRLGDEIVERFGGQLQVSTDRYPALSAQGALIPALTSGLFAIYATGRVYGAPVTPLRRPWISRALLMLKPLFGALARPLPRSDSPHVVHSQAMGRDYEVFVTLPDGWQAGSTRRYPLLFVLDANIELSIVAETAARLARAGETAEVIIVGIGTPRIEGHTEFAFRRFEELFPPHGDDALDDDLGRIMLGLYATRGKDARQVLGQAPKLYRFLVDELLPQLLRKLPVADGDIGILGHSAAGAFVGYAMYQADTPFRRCIAVSPGVGISRSWLMREPATVPPGTALYVALGSEERS